MTKELYTSEYKNQALSAVLGGALAPGFAALAVALALAKLGYHVFPVAAADMNLPIGTGARKIEPKDPLCKWKTVATNDPPAVRELFSEALRWVRGGGYGPECIGVGVSTAPSGIVVIDYDRKHGTIAELQGQLADAAGMSTDELAEMKTKGAPVITASDGLHHYFRAHPDVKVPKAENVGGIEGVDVRGDDSGSVGYVCAIGTAIGNGYRRAGYDWNDENDNDGRLVEFGGLLPPVASLDVIPNGAANEKVGH